MLLCPWQKRRSILSTLGQAFAESQPEFTKMETITLFMILLKYSLEYRNTYNTRKSMKNAGDPFFMD